MFHHIQKPHLRFRFCNWYRFETEMLSCACIHHDAVAFRKALASRRFLNVIGHSTLLYQKKPWTSLFRYSFFLVLYKLHQSCTSQRLDLTRCRLEDSIVLLTTCRVQLASLLDVVLLSYHLNTY